MLSCLGAAALQPRGGPSRWSGVPRGRPVRQLRPPASSSRSTRGARVPVAPRWRSRLAASNPSDADLPGHVSYFT